MLMTILLIIIFLIALIYFLDRKAFYKSTKYPQCNKMQDNEDIQECELYHEIFHGHNKWFGG